MPLYLPTESDPMRKLSGYFWIRATHSSKKEGETPLHFAAKEGHKEIGELLISKGADMNEKEKEYSNTPVDFAARRKHTTTADLLRKHGGKTGEELKVK